MASFAQTRHRVTKSAILDRSRHPSIGRAVCRGLLPSRSSQPSEASLVSFQPPCLPAQHCQRRWDTSPYRMVHRLTHKRLNKPKWPYGGSLAWKPTWGPEQVSGPNAEDRFKLVSLDGSPVWMLQDEATTTQGRSTDKSPRPELLRQRLQTNLAISASDAMVLIQRGRVAVDSRKQISNCWVEPAASVTVNGHPLETLSSLALLAHKPVGHALTETDPLKRPTYASLLPGEGMLARPVSRLDIGSSGLLVLTNRQDLVRALEREDVHATFVVRLRAPIHPTHLRQLQDQHNPCYAAAGARFVRIAPEGAHTEESQAAQWRVSGNAVETLARAPAIRVTLAGRGARPPNIRRILAAVGAPRELDICCVGLGPLSLEAEPPLEEMPSMAQHPGQVRPLCVAEIEAVLRHAASCPSESNM